MKIRTRVGIEDLEDFIERRLRHGRGGGVSRGRLGDLQDEVDRLRLAFTKVVVLMLKGFEPSAEEVNELLDLGPFEFVTEDEP